MGAVHCRNEAAVPGVSPGPNISGRSLPDVNGGGAWVVPSHARSVSLTSSDRSAGPTIRFDPETLRRERVLYGQPTGPNPPRRLDV